MRVLLFKRFESSVCAFRLTVERLVEIHRRFLLAMEEGVIPAGEEAQAILSEPNSAEEDELVEALRQASERYEAAEFDVERLRTTWSTISDCSSASWNSSGRLLPMRTPSCAHSGRVLGKARSRAVSA